MDVHRISSALVAALALAMLYALPPLMLLSVPLTRLHLVPLFEFLKERLRQARLALRHAPTGILLIGALANAGGLAF